MKNYFYAFLANQWMFNGLTEEQLSSYVPTFISEDEKKQIMVMPRA